MTYKRDSLGRVSHREVIGQPGVDYAYDSVGNLLSAAMPQASVSFTYDARNRPLTIMRPNGVTTAQAYDPVGRVLSIVHSRGPTALHSLGYSYDAAGNRVSQQTSGAQPLTTQPANVTYDDGNRLIQRAGTSFSYDDTGNLVSESGPAGTTTYTWDSRNRLTRITSPNGQTSEFQHDFAANMIRQTDSGPTLDRVQTFVLDEITNVAYQSSSESRPFSILTGQGIDSHWATVTDSGQVEYSLVDAINSTVATVDQTGTVKGRFYYEPFGATTASGSSFPFQFTGRVPLTADLYYYRARCYNSVLGRFLSEDPIGLSGGDTNLYRYALNRPLQLADPSGRIAGPLIPLAVFCLQRPAICQAIIAGAIACVEAIIDPEYRNPDPNTNIFIFVGETVIGDSCEFLYRQIRDWFNGQPTTCPPAPPNENYTVHFSDGTVRGR